MQGFNRNRLGRHPTNGWWSTSACFQKKGHRPRSWPNVSADNPDEEDDDDNDFSPLEQDLQPLKRTRGNSEDTIAGGGPAPPPPPPPAAAPSSSPTQGGASSGRKRKRHPSKEDTDEDEEGVDSFDD